MPVGLLRLRTATPPELERFHDDPEGLRAFVSGVVERAGAELIELYFDVGREHAYAIVENLDDYATFKAVSRILGTEDYVKVVRVDKAIEAIELERRLRPDSESSS
jgi:hypothetical protein